MKQGRHNFSNVLVVRSTIKQGKQNFYENLSSNEGEFKALAQHFRTSRFINVARQKFVKHASSRVITYHQECSCAFLWLNVAFAASYISDSEKFSPRVRVTISTRERRESRCKKIVQSARSLVTILAEWNGTSRTSSDRTNANYR